VTDSDGGGEAAPEIGKQAPEITADSVQGDGPMTLANARGQVVIVDFWATFCDPCRKSFPQYQELVDKYAGDLAVIAVSVDDPEDVDVDEVKKFANDLEVSFPIVWDKTKATADIYKPPKMPTSYIVDKQGIIRHIHEGFTGGEAAEIDEEVQELIK
jgi:peroxiredoxin